MDAPTDSILVAIAGDTAHLRVLGRGSFKVSPALKKFGVAAMDRGCRRFRLDMGECAGMDSTFMGVLAGMAMRARREGGGSFTLANLSAKNLSLLQTLGLDRIMELHAAAGDGAAGARAAAGAMTPLDTTQAGRHATAQTMLSAHEDLVSVSPDNLPKFRDVLAYLREDVRAAGEADEGRR